MIVHLVAVDVYRGAWDSQLSFDASSHSQRRVKGYMSVKERSVLTREAVLEGIARALGVVRGPAGEVGSALLGPAAGVGDVGGIVLHGSVH